MELDKLKSLVGTIRDNERLQAERLAETNGDDEWKAAYARLTEWNPKVREWIENLDWLSKNGYRMTTSVMRDFYGVPKEQVLCADFIYHEFGLIMEDGKEGFALMGILTGTLGSTHVLTDGNEWWLQKGMTLCTEGKTQITVDEIDNILANYGGMKSYLERFEEKYERLIRMIRLKAGDLR